ncbi:MAG: hypothetical protein LAN71_08225 [Acidobacteriia bacterium]|nr:hypothetical protein [Terriglobia bacterium]
MVTGHNSNAVWEGVTYHVQTEARKSGHPFIDSLVFLKGRVLHRRSVGFAEMLPITLENEAQLQKRVDEQHHRVVDEVRAGKVQLDGRPAAKAAEQPKPAAEWKLDFLNPQGWLAKGHAHLEVRLLEKESQEPVAGAEIQAEIEGAAEATKAAAKSGEDGRAELDFAMPALGAGEAALVIRAGAAQRRFLLRAKAKS